MLEVELKYRVDGFSEIERRLEKLGVTPLETRQETDEYFNAPDRDFGQTDEALRLRRIGDVNVLTYKGPKCDALSKTRTEVEASLTPGQDNAESMMQILRSLGYRPVTAVRKMRRRYHVKWEGISAEASLDEVDEVGTYVELECMAEDSAMVAVRDALLRLARYLNLTVLERRSYLTLLLALRGSGHS